MRRPKDLTNTKFHMLTPIKIVGSRKNYKLWLCKCDCGNETEVISSNILSGHTKSCGCLHEFIDYNLIGKKINKLTVIAYAEKRRNHYFYECLCECGNKVVFNKLYIKSGGAKSCGCHKRGKSNYKWTGYEEISGTQWAHIKRHAKIRNLEFNVSIQYVWNLYIQQNRRCTLSGLYIQFISPMKPKYKSEVTASLDRIDSSLGYIEGNVQWIHKDLQDMKWSKDQKYFILLCNLIARTNPVTFIEAIPHNNTTGYSYIQ